MAKSDDLETPPHLPTLVSHEVPQDRGVDMLGLRSPAEAAVVLGDLLVNRRTRGLLGTDEATNLLDSPEARLPLKPLPRSLVTRTYAGSATHLLQGAPEQMTATQRSRPPATVPIRRRATASSDVALHRHVSLCDPASRDDRVHELSDGCISGTGSPDTHRAAAGATLGL